MLFELDIKDERWFDYLAEKNEQEADEEEYNTFFDVDSAWEEDLEQWRD